MKKNIDRYHRTTSFPIACFLYSKGQQIAGINATDIGNKKEFVFIKTDFLTELVNIYRFGDRDDERLDVQVHLYEQARRELLDRLNEESR